jgi:hypothetical protein
MNIDVALIERLREAAKEHGAVYDLLFVINGSFLITDSINRVEFVAGDEEVSMLEGAKLAFEFAKFDRKDEE